MVRAAIVCYIEKHTTLPGATVHTRVCRWTTRTYKKFVIPHAAYPDKELHFPSSVALAKHLRSGDKHPAKSLRAIVRLRGSTVPRFTSKAEWLRSLGPPTPPASPLPPPLPPPPPPPPPPPLPPGGESRGHSQREAASVLAQIAALDAALLQKAGGELGRRPSFHLEVCERNWVVMGDQPHFFHDDECIAPTANAFKLDVATVTSWLRRAPPDAAAHLQAALTTVDELAFAEPQYASRIITSDVLHLHGDDPRVQEWVVAPPPAL